MPSCSDHIPLAPFGDILEKKENDLSWKISIDPVKIANCHKKNPTRHTVDAGSNPAELKD